MYVLYYIMGLRSFTTKVEVKKMFIDTVKLPAKCKWLTDWLTFIRACNKVRTCNEQSNIDNESDTREKEK